MALYFPNQGEQALLDMLVNSTWSSDLRIGLYQNNYTPIAGSVLADFTAATFSGYAAVAATWNAATIVAAKGQIVQNPDVDFTHNGGATSNTIYGVYLFNSAAGKIIAAELLAAPFFLANNGDKITVGTTINCSTA